jgi:hypothetical protein
MGTAHQTDLALTSSDDCRKPSHCTLRDDFLRIERGV